jgi:prolyl oligopeptidase
MPTQYMDRRALLASSAALAGAFAAPKLALAQSAGGPPVAPVHPVTDTYFGTTVVDPYRWMEAEGPEWKTYALAEAAYAKSVLDRIPGRDALVAAIAKDTSAVVSVSSIQIGGDYIFTEVRPAGANTFKLFVRRGLHGADRMLIDSDRYAPVGSHASLDWWAPSLDGSHVVFGVSPGGSENSTARIMVTETSVVLPETIDRTENAGPSWVPDGSGFFYTRLQPGVAGDSLDKYKLSACWFHRLNTDAATDVKVLWQGSSPVVKIADIDFPSVQSTPGSDLVFGAVISGVQREVGVYVADLSAATKGAPVWRTVCLPSDKVTSGAVHGDDIFLLSHNGASNYKVIKTTALNPAVATGKVVVPPSASVIVNFTAAKDALYIQDLNAGLGGLRRMAYDSGEITTLAMPFAGSIQGLYADTLHDGVWFFLQGWVRPTTLCFVGRDGVVVQTDIAPQPPIDVSPYTSEEVFATAADGVKIPLSIIYKKGLKRDGSAPVLLSIYGSYGITEDPYFIARWLPLLDLGGVFAVGHVRGGGELGEDWHLAGYKLTKFNTWRDTIACAEHLIKQGYTSKAKLGIVGGSAGGITVGRFMTERPDLAAVVIDRVGVSNASRSEFSPNGPPNIPEFGTVTEKEGFKGLYEMDAYLHVKDGVKYPSVLLTTGLNDPRVSSWEPTKMTARLQAANGGPNPIILRIDVDAGHGIGSTRSQRDRETGDIIAFLMWRTGDPRYQPKG